MMDFAKDKNRTIVERAPMSMPRAVVVAAAVGTAFGLGVVSARAAGPSPEQQAVVEVDTDRGDALARADARTKAYEAVVKQATSTWHAELTGPETAVASALPTKAAAVAAAEEPSSSPTVDADVVRAPEPVVEAKPAVADAEPAARDQNEDRDDEEGDVDTGAKPEKLAAAINKVLGEKKEPAPGDTRRYAVQLASTPKKDSAAREAADFVARGVPAKVVAAEVPGKGTMYRVRVSGLATRAAADAMKARIGQGLVVTDD
jgi:hypothetical protein